VADIKEANLEGANLVEVNFKEVKRLTLIFFSGTIEHLFHPVPDPAAHAVLRWFRNGGRT
jgi:hypothetical protein